MSPLILVVLLSNCKTTGVSFDAPFFKSSKYIVMKKKFYDVGTYIYMCEQKRGTELIIAAAIAGAASLASAGINAASQSSANAANMQLTKETLNEQKALFHEANDFNHNEAALARNFNAEQSQLSRDFNSAEAAENRVFQAGMIQKYMDYNSPNAQYQRYLQAGLNPATLAGNINNQGFSIPSGAAGTSTPATISAASAAGVPNLPTAHVNPVDYGGLARDPLTAISSVIESGKAYETYKGTVTENQFKKLTIEKGLELSDSEIKRNYADAKHLINESALAEQKIKESASIVENLDSKTKQQDVETQISNIKKLYANDFYKYQAKKLEEDYKFTKGQAATIVKYTYAKIAAAYGSAAQSYAMAEYYEALKQLPAAERAQIEAATEFMGTQNAREKYGLFLDRQFGWKERFWSLEGQKEGVDNAKYHNSGTYRFIQGVKDTAIGVGGAVGTAFGVSKGMKSVRNNQGNYIYGNPNFNMNGSF